VGNSRENSRRKWEFRSFSIEKPVGVGLMHVEGRREKSEGCPLPQAQLAGLDSKTYERENT
jgi:hypothetical protein